MKNTFKNDLFIDKKIYEQIHHLCSTNVTVEDYNKYGLKSCSVFFKKTVFFPNGKEMDIKVCSSDKGEPCWCEAVLFDENGFELCFTEVTDEINQEWSLINNDIKYIVNVHLF